MFLTELEKVAEAHVQHYCSEQNFSSKLTIQNIQKISEKKFTCDVLINPSNGLIDPKVASQKELSFSFLPKSNWVAIFARGIPVALETKGTVLEALGFASMIKTISTSLKLHMNSISIKASTTEGLGFTGREEGLACICNVTIKKNN